MEPASFTLGAIALIPVAYKAYIKCSGFLNALRLDDGIFSTWTIDLSLQQEIFTRECQLFLCGIVNPDIAEQMLDDEKHPQWNEQDFVAWCASHMSKPREAALRACLEVLETTSIKLTAAKGFKGPAAVLSGSLEPSTAVRLGAADSGSSGTSFQKYVDKARRMKWLEGGQAEVAELLTKLRVYNKTLRTLRKQDKELKKRRRHGKKDATNQPIEISSEWLPPPLEERSTSWDAVRDCARRLKEGLAFIPECACHSVDLRLEGTTYLQNTGSHGRANFKLMISSKNSEGCSDEAQPEYLCVLVESAPCAREDTEGATSILKPSSQMASKRKLLPPCDSIRVQPLPTPPNASQCVGRSRTMVITSSLSSRQQTDTIVISPSSSHSSFQLACEDISPLVSLCTAKIYLPMPSTPSSRYLGFLSTRTTTTETHRHLLYKEALRNEPSQRLALSELLSNNGNVLHFARLERLRMASMISLAVLHFGSLPLSPWLGHRWASDDIYVFLNGQGKPVVSRQCGEPPLAAGTFAPHVSALRPTQSRSERRSPWPLAKNSQLFSLAYVLTELAYGKPFADIESSRSASPLPTNNNDDTPGDRSYIKQYIKLREIVEDRLHDEAGRKFASAVSACFHAKLSKSHDLTDEGTRAEYYEKVVKKLQECVKVLEED